MDILRELKGEQDAEALRLGDKWVETYRLFTKWNGEEMNNQTPYGWLKEFCKNNDLPFMVFTASVTLRHLLLSLQDLT